MTGLQLVAIIVESVCVASSPSFFVETSPDPDHRANGQASDVHIPVEPVIDSYTGGFSPYMRAVKFFESPPCYVTLTPNNEKHC